MQNVKALEADVRLTRMKADHGLAQLEFQNINLKSQTKLYETKSISIDQYELAAEQQRMAQAAYLEAESEAAPPSRPIPQINGVNTTVSLQAQLDQARFYLDNTLMRAPEDGKVVNLQVQPGMRPANCAPAPSPPSSAMRIAICSPPSPRKASSM